MSDYIAPIDDMKFALENVLGFTHDELDSETIDAILTEAAKLACDILAPLNASGDHHGAKLENGNVITAPGFKDAYAQYCEGGWNAVPFDPEYDGQGLPWAMAFPVQEMWQAANMSFGLCPLLNQGAVEAIYAHGSQELKDTYLPKLISGQWTGTMNLTEPQAGSDLGLVKAKAEKDQGDTYKITGQKIFITYGDHDMAGNIIHLVLARLPDAPDDVKGISLFVVPKILNDGSANSLECIGLEHKLGIHASPTCTMQFDGATGYLVGEAHQGLKYMFTMMNNARLSVGLQGVAIADRAYQHALSYAQERVQGKDIDGKRTTIDQHADIKRNLMTMRAQILAGRLMAYRAAIALDAKDPIVEILTPIVKSWCTDMSVEVASIGIQIHGGMGFIEETGAAQYLRDARILPIYEGTNGIQAMDLLFRKTVRDQGQGIFMFLDSLQALGGKEDLIVRAKTITQDLVSKGNYDQQAFCAQPYLKALALITADAYLQKASQAAQDCNNEIKSDYQNHAEFFRKHILPQVSAALESIVNA